MEEQQRQFLRAEELRERMQVMFWQEQSQYKTVDYLLNSSEQSMAFPLLEGDQDIMNAQWRTKMCEWAYQLVDHFDFPREIVGTCMNYLDRYLARHFSAEEQPTVPILGKKHFQLVTMTCLYIAIKLSNCRSQLSIAFMVRLSRNSITAAEIQAMEHHLCGQLGWFMHPPTSFDFSKHYLRLLFPLEADNAPVDKNQDSMLRFAMEESAAFLVELSVLDYFFVTQRPSTVAMASIYLVLEEHEQRLLQEPTTHTSSSSPMVDFLIRCRQYLGTLVSPEEYYRVEECRQRLASLHSSSTNGLCQDIKDQGRMESPVSVFHPPSQ